MTTVTGARDGTFANVRDIARSPRARQCARMTSEALGLGSAAAFLPEDAGDLRRPHAPNT